MTDILNALVLLANFVLVPGLAYGSQLALGALGVTMIYAVLRFSNFAHGETMSFGAMITILVTWWLQEKGITFGVLPTALLALPAQELRDQRYRKFRAMGRFLDPSSSDADSAS